jgi:hypothetical protein
MDPEDWLRRLRCEAYGMSRTHTLTHACTHEEEQLLTLGELRETFSLTDLSSSLRT